MKDGRGIHDLTRVSAQEPTSGAIGRSVTVRRMTRDVGRRDHIEEAALELFAERGFAGTGIRDIAARVGLVSSALYHYVGTKEELLASIMRRGVRKTTEAVTTALESIAEPESRLAVLVEVHVALQLHDPRTANVVDGEVSRLEGKLRDEIVELRDRYEGLWADIVDSGVESGVFHVSDPKLARLGLLEMCNSVSRWFKPRGKKDVVRIAVCFADLALGALRAKRGNRPLVLSDLSIPDPEELVELAERFLTAPAPERAEAAEA